jgi:hypothetical protein
MFQLFSVGHVLLLDEFIYILWILKMQEKNIYYRLSNLEQNRNKLISVPSHTAHLYHCHVSPVISHSRIKILMYSFYFSMIISIYLTCFKKTHCLYVLQVFSLHYLLRILSQGEIQPCWLYNFIISSTSCLESSLIFRIYK